MRNPKKPTPPAEAWIETATRHAKARGVNPISVIIGDKQPPRPVVLARWCAWREMLKRFPECGIAGLSRVSGFDHSSISTAMRNFRERKALYERRNRALRIAKAPPANESPEARMRRIWKEQAALTRVYGGEN